MSKTLPTSPFKQLIVRWRHWWRQQTPNRQDRFAFIAPLAAVVLFMAAITTAFWYLRYEEIVREQEVVRRDVEYAQQRLRLRLLDKQEQIMRMARDIANRETDSKAFSGEAQTLLNQSPELASLTWLNARQHVHASYASASNNSTMSFLTGNLVTHTETLNTFHLARDLQQPVYSQPIIEKRANAAPYTHLQLQVPIVSHNKFEGVLVAEYTMDGMLRFAVPNEIANRYAVSLRDVNNNVLAGQANKARPKVTEVLPWLFQTNEYEVPITPVGYALSLHAQAYRTSQGLIGNGVFWLVAVLSAMTAWMLIGTWRHTRRRVQAQQALVAETNFRRAMENSILTGMRAMDLKGRITYVNAAFCQMTGWTEDELVGRVPPFPYWPEEDRETLEQKLTQELQGDTTASGFQVRVKRKSGEVFDARLYVSPLVDARGQQTGWMTSMTDITEPNRVREQLSAAHDRFTTVLEGLDASVSVAPLGSKELLFANKLYRQWFATTTQGHLSLVTQAGQPRTLSASTASDDDSQDQDDGLMGLPTEGFTETKAENAEIFLPELGKWLEVRSRYLNWVDGRLAQMVIASDITPRRQAEEQAQMQAERAQSASRLITMGEMASSVAHELNQPLTAINNYCSGMVSRIKANNLSEEELLKALEKTAHQAQRAGQIIQRIRTFVKRSEPNRTPSDVTAMVGEAVELAGIEMRRRQVRLTQVLAARLPAVNVDPILIEQVLVNLMRNAAESIDLAQRPLTQRDVELKVLPRNEEGQAVVEFSVTDTGRGLPPEVMERLFEAFFSTKSEGMGIGLNLCRSIVESHQGRMKAENLYNGADITGCRFSFWIPVR
ncbi:PAS domain-containing sensor histidine kinase [Limnohabitans sp. Rim8]|uniref:histidine kinase n=1 Tax=Limnohabitans curvus TaxID=323423 RepID=A0A315ET71_9BURK|nr:MULTISPECIES: PAS domain-containing sensor histidine kinase [Limnohabitans]PUE60481.1 PAS domain-containing sensor histidine kinase [Limnohabitans curvus]PUE61011.1 PAS domain-containing sensor histidine kinase [Limnohabitans sp. Rim8]